MHFKARAGAKLADVKLQAALKKLQSNFVKGRADRMAEIGNFEALRTHAAAIRDHALANLDVYLEEFEKNATARGAVVHWAETTADVNRIVCELAARYELCEDMAQLLTEQAANLQFQLGITEDLALERCLQGMLATPAVVSEAEARWVVCRLAELLHWPLPAWAEVPLA